MKQVSPKSCLNYLVAVLLLSTSFSAPVRADELCPDTTKGEQGLTVNDMADLQFDIGRLNLCLQRARLLQQIDETVKKREVIRSAPLAAEMNGNGFGGIPPMASMPPLPGERSGKVLSSSEPLPPAVPVLSALPEATTNGEWKIQRIWGQGNVMQAQLVKNDVIANVKKGDTLPSGEKVIELSGRGITVDNGKKQTVLSWLADGKSDNAAGQGQ